MFRITVVLAFFSIAWGTHAGNRVSFRLEIPQQEFSIYFQGEKPKPIQCSFRLNYSIQKQERIAFSLDEVNFSPSATIRFPDPQGTSHITGKAFYNGTCVAVRIPLEKAMEKQTNYKHYAVSTVFCWAFPAQKLVFEEIIAWSVVVEGKEIIAAKQTTGLQGHTKSWRLKKGNSLGNSSSPSFLIMALEAGADPNEGWEGRAYTQPECLRILLKYGADANWKRRDTLTPLMCATLQRCDPSVFTILFDYGADANLVDKENHNALIWAARNRNSEKIIRLLANRTTDLNARSKTGFSAMGELLYYADAELLCDLFKQGAKSDLNSDNIQSLVRDSKRLKIILASPDGRKDFEVMATDIMATALALNLESANFLHSLGWKWQGLTFLQQGQEEISPLYLAAALGQDKNLAFMVDKLSYPISVTTKNGLTLLMIAVAYKNLSTVKFLLERGVDPIIRDHAGTPIPNIPTTPEIKKLLEKHTLKK